jgi:hypothetical protein
MKAFLICTAFFTCNIAHAGPWPKCKGEIYLKLSQWWVIYDEYYDQEKNIESLARTRSIGNTSIYAEYGISKRFTAILYFPFFSKATLFELKDKNSSTIIKEGDAISSIGDTDIALLYGLIMNKPVVLSASLSFGLPFGINSGEDGGSLQTGDGEFNQMLKLEAGSTAKIGKFYPYMIMFMGVNNRTQNFSDELHYGTEAGVTMGIITFIMRVYGVKSFFNGSTNESVFQEIPGVNNTEFLNIAPEFNINFSEKAGISFTYFKALSGRFYFRNPSCSLGIFVKLK